jgi:hypothetical protein
MAVSSNTTSNSMIFKNYGKNYTIVESNNLDVSLLDTFDISGISMTNNLTDTSEIVKLPFQPQSNNDSLFINSIKFIVTPADSSKDALSLYLDGVKTIYTLNYLHFVKEYPYITNGTTSQPSSYALAIEFNSYTNPVKDKLIIYIIISDTIPTNDKGNKLLDYLTKDFQSNFSNSSMNREITKTSELRLTNVIPSKNNYYCHSFTDKNNVNVKNIFFDNNYTISYEPQTNFDLKTRLAEKMISTDALLNYTIETNVPYYYKSSKYINYVSYLNNSPMSDIYIDCSPADMVLDEKENIPYLQKMKSSMQYGGENLTLGLSYLVFILVIGLIVYFIFKIPSLFRSKEMKLMDNAVKAVEQVSIQISQAPK